MHPDWTCWCRDAGADAAPAGAVLLSFASAVCGCVGELYHASFAMQLDDNFTVPVLGALGATGMASLALLAI